MQFGDIEVGKKIHVGAGVEAVLFKICPVEIRNGSVYVPRNAVAIEGQSSGHLFFIPDKMEARLVE